MARISLNTEDLTIQYLPAEQCLRTLLPDAFGMGCSKTFTLDQGLTYIETRYTPSTDITVLSSQELSEPRMVLTLALNGHSRFVGDCGNEVIFKQGFASITTFGSTNGKRHYQADRGTSLQLRLSVDKSRLEQMFGTNTVAAFFGHSPMEVLSCRPISSKSVHAAQQLTACDVAEPVKGLYRQGLAMTILAAELHHLFPKADPIAANFSKQDRAKAMLARDILSDEFRKPPSVGVLAKRVGTNQFKLKQLFHHFFSNTPYGLLFEIRMNHAYQLLKTGEYHVGMAADLVGYRHASNFSAAFSKHFGVSPKRIAKQHCHE